jgi:hypothetical protein
MALWIKKTTGTTQSSWKNPSAVWIKKTTGTTQTSWTKVKKMYVKKASAAWALFYPNTGPYIDTDVTLTKSTPTSPSYTVTLTGTNNKWSTNTGEVYYFKHSSDGGTTYNTLKTGTAVDSGVYTYTLLNNGTDVTPNVNNIYVFTVEATDSSGISTSQSNLTSFAGAENITISLTSKTANTAIINWTSAPSANRYMVEYKKAADSSWTTSGNGAGGRASSPATLTGLTQNTPYSVRVIPWTGSSDNTGYAGNYSNTLAFTTNPTPPPTQLTKPTISGTGKAFTSISATSGTYQSGTYSSKTTSIAYYIGSMPSLTDGLTTLNANGTISTPHNVTQSDATTPVSYFYAVDIVTTADGTIFYFYSSANLKATVGTITDDYSRTISTAGSSLGIMTPASNSVMSPNSYIYNGPSTSSNWKVDGQVAINTTNPAIGSTNAAAYPFQTVELSGKTDLTVSVNTYLLAGAGTGVMFWAASTGSWYAASSYQYTGTATVYTCNQTGGSNTTGCPADNSGVANGVCGCTSSTSSDYACNQPGGSGVSTCTNGSNSAGAVCNCTATTTTSCSGPGYTGYTDISSAIAACGAACVQTLPGTTTYAFSGASSINYPPAPTSSVCNSSTVGYTQTGSVVYSSGLYRWNQCTATSSGSTYGCTHSSVSSTTYSYNTRSSTPTVTTTYTWKTNDSGSTVTAYLTNLRIYAASGSTVSILSDVTKASSTSGYTSVGGIKVATSGNTITAGLYSDLNFASLINSNTVYTATSPVKAAANGASSAGIFKAGSNNQGTTWDNLSIV